MNGQRDQMDPRIKQALDRLSRATEDMRKGGESSADSRRAAERLGEAVHIPTHGAHWVKNHDNVSVSLSLNFEFPHWLQADVYRTNHYLRRVGLSPLPPGRSVVVDRMKGTLGFGLRQAKQSVGRVYRSAQRLFRG